MVRLLLILVAILSHSGCLSQKSPADCVAYSISDSSNDENIFGCILEIEAETPSGWIKFLEDNLQLDSIAIDSIPAGNFTVVVQFAIERNGQLNDVRIIKDPGYGLGQRVKKVLSGYKDQWKPSVIKNQTVSSTRIQPITFVVEEDECELPLTTKIIP